MAGREGAAFQHALVLLLAVAVGLSFGLCYGLANHNTYLLYPLRELDPEFLRYDWLAAQTTAYHRNFALLIEILASLGPAPWTVAGANVALVAALMLTIYGFLYRHYRRDALVAILLLMCFVLLEKTRSVASGHILTSVLEPSSVAASAVLIGLLLLLAERYFWSGVLVAIGGFFHTNFLLLDFVFFGLVHLAFGREDIARRLCQQLGPSVAVLLFEFPMLYAMATDPLGGEARYIFQFIRSPHHYVPRKYLADFIPFSGWHLLAMSCLELKSSEARISSRLAKVYAVFLGLVMTATVLTTVIHVPFVSQLFFWRMAPFSVLLAQLIIITRIAPYFTASAERETAKGFNWQWLLAAAGGGLILIHHGSKVQPTEVGLLQVNAIYVVIAILTLFAYVLLARAKTRRYLTMIPPLLVPLGLLVVGLAFSAAPAYKASNVLHGLSASKQELVQWAQSTAPEAQFLIPPSLKTFRLHAARAVVVDWKSTPIKPAELIEWYRRLGRVSGDPKVRNPIEAGAGYRRMDQSRLASLAREFEIDYAVFKQPFDARRLQAEVVFNNKRYLVLKLGATSEDSARQD
ncbi:MAG: DUF6798 domain-containing protein [Gammaproteobacteria bacterium]